MKWLKKIGLGITLAFIFFIPAKSKQNSISSRVNTVRKSLKSKSVSNTLKDKLYILSNDELRKDWVNWNNWGNWANWNNWNNWRNWSNWNNWGNWGNG